MQKLPHQALENLQARLDRAQRLRPSAVSGARGHLFGLLMSHLNSLRLEAGQSCLSAKIHAEQDWEALIYEVELFLKRQQNL